MKTFTTSIIALVVLCSTFFVSCMKEGRKGKGKDENKAVTLTVSLKKSEVYNLDLSAYGDEDDLATIETQADAYTVSAISKSTSFYNYQFQYDGDPKATTAAKETVVLKVYEPEGHCHTEQTLVTINFTIE